jgi:hypothetical protein
VKRRTGPPQPPKTVKPSTVRSGRLGRDRRPPRPKHRTVIPQPSLRPPKTAPRPRQIAHIVDEDQASVLDLIDNMLNKGVLLNADLILALANVDLVYVRLSALLCAADRVLGRRRRAKERSE